MLTYRFLLFLVILSHSGSSLANDAGAVTQETGNTIKAQPDLLDHLGIEMNVTAPIEAEEEYVENPESSIPVPRERPPQIQDQREEVLRQQAAEDAAAQVRQIRGGQPATRQASGNPTPTNNNGTPTTEQGSQNGYYNNQNQNTGSNTVDTGSFTYNPGTVEVGTDPNTNTSTRPRVVQGLLYSNDKEDQKENETAKPNTVVTNNTILQGTPPTNTGTTAVDKSKKVTPSNSDNPFVSAARNTASADQPFGGFNSGGGSKKAAVQAASVEDAPAQEALNKMNRESGFFGTSGSRRRGSSFAGMNDKNRLSASQARGLASLPKSQKLMDPRSILEARLKRIQQRGIASVGEMDRSDNFLFYSICQHYDNYEKNNNINLGTTRCPSP